ncbi:hypothetical protein AAFF_G00203330 [Aldrovandia affinis]|uniref:Uncharacterized protein n=1 Tax=Aldrovandia affinis TaxID=143900 RepID=A0AAD7WV39_9TELE|nr:hypothetical protein AAFF_G00203330 [Aldrovandia affinis]
MCLKVALRSIRPVAGRVRGRQTTRAAAAVRAVTGPPDDSTTRRQRRPCCALRHRPTDCSDVAADLSAQRPDGRLRTLNAGRRASAAVETFSEARRSIP